jgi:hypothetical protein
VLVEEPRGQPMHRIQAGGEGHAARRQLASYPLDLVVAVLQRGSPGAPSAALQVLCARRRVLSLPVLPHALSLLPRRLAGYHRPGPPS